jgi:mono/diheme cytochrome c family protein
MKWNPKAAAGVALVLAAAWLGAPRPASATIEIQKKAKEAGVEATNCLYCHGEKLPKKDAHTFNDRGKWLKAEKDKRKAKVVDVSWLKEYVAPKP